MDPSVFRFPPPYSGLNFPRQNNESPHFMTAEGMMMPGHLQPPPMYGPRGSTIPPKYFQNYAKKNLQHRNINLYCETCDSDFNSCAALEQHINEHQQCGIDGCAFVGHPQMIARHVEQQHNSGLFDKLKNVNTPEEIAKWREARRKRFPTQANVALRQQLQEAKRKRGERLDEKKSRFGSRRDRNKCRPNEASSTAKGGGKKRKRMRRRRQGLKNEDIIVEECTGTERTDESETESGVKRFKGTSELCDYSRPKVKEAKQKNALTCLAGMYGSSDSGGSGDESSDNQLNKSRVHSTDSKDSSQYSISSDEDDHLESPPELFDLLSNLNAASSPAPKSTLHDSQDQHPEQSAKKEYEVPAASPVCVSKIQEPASSPPKNEIENKTSIASIASRPKTNESDNEDQQEDVPFKRIVETFNEPEAESKDEATEVNGKRPLRRRVRTPRKPNEDEASQPKNKVAKKTPGLDYSRLWCRRQNTMLEKLLLPDIIHERNVLLQCVRYVMERNFFGIGQAKQ